MRPSLTVCPSFPLTKQVLLQKNWAVRSGWLNPRFMRAGRGKGKFKEESAGEKGGVRLAFSKEEVIEFVGQMLGATLVTNQTGEAGKQVNRIYIEDGADIDRELYLSILVDRTSGRVAFVVSTEGGMDIEAVAERDAGQDSYRADQPGCGSDGGQCDRAVRCAEAGRHCTR